jgi:hypothetical protein
MDETELTDPQISAPGLVHRSLGGHGLRRFHLSILPILAAGSRLTFEKQKV